MIIVNFKGGLGNQLFQYSFGKSLAKKFKQKFYIDKSIYSGLKEKREFLIENFDIKFDGYYKNLKDKRLKKILNFLKQFNFFSKLKIYNEKFYHYDKNILSLNFKKNNYYFDGYWQSYKYFLKNLNSLKKELTLKNNFKYNKDLIKKLKSKCSVAIHIRGGDYRIEPFNSFNGLLNEDYYNLAYSTIKKKINLKKALIFTDDIEYTNIICKKFYFDYEIISFKKTKSALEDFELFSMSKNKIISNSTFAWWSALLSNSKVVIYPSSWFKIKYNNTKNLFPKFWQKI